MTRTTDRWPEGRAGPDAGRAGPGRGTGGRAARKRWPGAAGLGRVLRPAHPAAWALAPLVLAAGLLGPTPPAARLWALGAAGVLVYVFGRLAAALSGRLPAYHPTGVRRGPSGYGDGARALSGFETERLPERVRLALRSADFFGRRFAAYLGSLALGRPLTLSDIWWADARRAAEGREALAGLAGGEPWPGRRPPTVRELEDLVGKVEEAYEHGRRSPGV